MSIRNNIFNVSRRKVGGIWFVKLGRVNISFCVSRPRSILEVQRMDCTTWRDARQGAELQRALRTRARELEEAGACMDTHPSSVYVASPYSYDRD